MKCLKCPCLGDKKCAKTFLLYITQSVTFICLLRFLCRNQRIQEIFYTNKIVVGFLLYPFSFTLHNKYNNYRLNKKKDYS